MIVNNKINKNIMMIYILMILLKIVHMIVIHKKAIKA